MYGKIDGWSSKSFGLLLLPCTNLMIYLLLWLCPKMDPRIRRSPDEYDRTIAAMQIMRLVVLVFMSGVFYLQALAALGFSVAMDQCVFNGCLLLFMVMGNYLSNIRPNYFLGIRTPWTLENADTWRATHRIGGRILVFGSLILIAAQFFVSKPVFTYLFLAYGVGFALWSFAYSWNHSRTHPS